MNISALRGSPRAFALAGIAAPLVLSAAAAQTVSDQLIIRNASGKVVRKVTILESAKETPKIVIVTGVKFNKALYGHYLGFIEPKGNLSDVIGIYNAGSAGAVSLRFGFASDSETQGPNPTRFTVPGVSGKLIPEPSLPISVTQYLNTAAGSGQVGWTATFFSDSETGAGAASRAGGSVPEPAVWTMLLLGAGVTGWTLRRRRAAAAPL